MREVTTWAVFANRGVLGTVMTSKVFQTRQEAADHLAQLGPADGYVRPADAGAAA